ncbi:MAG: putative acyl-CoA transferase [Caulobacter sp.]|nr:putative acyl-CoA transferase [Caulobacter sp.]
MRDQVLSDLRIIDMAQGIAGPVAAMVLAEMGAEVVKVEPPAGDPQRGQPGFHVWNRSKRSITLDLPTDAEALHRLLAGADVLFHSHTQAEALALGLDDVALAERHPHLIACGVTGVPTGHAAQATPARDSLVLAEAGILDEQAAVRRDGPVYLRLPLGSWNAASLAAIGVLARLIHRDRGGRPGPAHTSLFQGALVPMAMYWHRAERPTAMLARGLPKAMEVSIFQCADGEWLHVMMGCDKAPWIQEEFARRGEVWVKAADAAAGDAFRIPFSHFGAVRELMKTRSRDAWVEHLQAHDVPVQPVLRFGALYGDEQARANGYVAQVDDPLFGATLQPGMPFSVSPPPRAPVGCRPLGADTRAVLGETWAAKAPPAAKSVGGAPLAGVKVLDLGAALAGPLATMLLADLGAEVIKVEPPEGEMMRILEGNFVGCQRGKRAMSLQLKDPASRQTLARLVEWADVVHHNLRMPAAVKLGIDYETLRRINPNIVYCHVSSYGPEGPRRDWPGMDQMFQSSSGWELAGAGRDNPPIWHRFGFTDHLCALASVEATLLALRRRDQTGEGQRVTASLLGATILTVSEAIVLPGGALTPVAEIDSLQLGLGPFERIYQAADGWIAVSEPDPARQTAMIAALGVGDAGACEAVIRDLSQAEALQRLSAAQVACAPVRERQRDAFFDSAENRAIGLRACYDHPVYGALEQPGRFWDFGDLQARLDRPPPALDQHTAEVLAELDAASRSGAAHRPPSA